MTTKCASRTHLYPADRLHARRGLDQRRIASCFSGILKNRYKKNMYKRSVQQISRNSTKKLITSKTLLSECTLNKESFNLPYMEEEIFKSNWQIRQIEQVNLKSSNKFQKNEFTNCERILKLDFKAPQTGLFGWLRMQWCT